MYELCITTPKADVQNSNYLQHVTCNLTAASQSVADPNLILCKRISAPDSEQAILDPSGKIYR
jgi:hypothetical protein